MDEVYIIQVHNIMTNENFYISGSEVSSFLTTDINKALRYDSREWALYYLSELKNDQGIWEYKLISLFVNNKGVLIQ